MKKFLATLIVLAITTTIILLNTGEKTVEEGDWEGDIAYKFMTLVDNVEGEGQKQVIGKEYVDGKVIVTYKVSRNEATTVTNKVIIWYDNRDLKADFYQE